MEDLKIKLRKVLIVLLVVWMIVVFGLSNQNGEQSGGLSRKVANFFARGDTVQAERLEPIIRKVAHMTEYATGGMIFYGILLTYPKSSRRKKVILSLAFVILYASTDEIHQLFISERSGSVKDVFIDTFGGVLGIFAMFIIETAIFTIDKRVKEDLANPKIEN